MKTVTFCGHKEVDSAEDVKEWLRKTVESLILRDADTFLLGGYGGFDLMAADVVWEAKKSHPQITSVLVIPYIDRKSSSKKYDETLYPPLEKVPKRFAISKRKDKNLINVSEKITEKGLFGPMGAKIIRSVLVKIWV